MINILISEYGTKNYYQDDNRHRVIGPAVIYQNSQYRAWYKYGKWHRTDGPARILDNGLVEYWINGKELSEYELMFMNESCV